MPPGEYYVRVTADGEDVTEHCREDPKRYGLELTDGNYGYMMCIPDNDYIGNYNLSFLVDGIGRSLPDPKLMYVHTNGIGMVQLYTEIEELSASAGSKNGGLMLTISGAYFDDTDSPVRVEVGGEDCEVQEPFTSSEIVCKTPPVPAPLPAEFTGGRGLKATVVEGTTDFETADWSTGVTSRVDEARLVTNAAGAHVTKMEGVLLVPETGKFQFYLNVKGSGKLTLTPLDVNTELLSFTSSVWNSIGKASSTLELQKGQKLKMVVMTSSSSSESEVAVTARLYNAVYLASQTGASRSEVQIFDFTSDVEQEVQLQVTLVKTNHWAE
nr:hypothetical protein BaRGS_015792 [Batillaria attramentaria]